MCERYAAGAACGFVSAGCAFFDWGQKKSDGFSCRCAAALLEGGLCLALGRSGLRPGGYGFVVVLLELEIVSVESSILDW